MNRKIVLTLLTVVSIGLFGCPYQSKIPLSKPEVKVNPKFFGLWESEDAVYVSYVISKLDPYCYLITEKTMTGDIHKYKGFISMIRGSMFLNAFSAEDNAYYLYRLKFDSGDKVVTVMPFSKKLKERFKDFPKKISDTQELNNFVWRSMNLRGFYDMEEEAVFMKKSNKISRW